MTPSLKLNGLTVFLQSLTPTTLETNLRGSEEASGSGISGRVGIRGVAAGQDAGLKFLSVSLCHAHTQTRLSCTIILPLLLTPEQP